MTARKRNERTPVTFRGQRVPGLFTRTLGDGSQVFEAKWKQNGRVRSQRLDARDVSEARQELHAVRAGVKTAGPNDGPTLNDLARERFADQQARTLLPANDRRRVSPRTVDVSRDRYDRYVAPKLGKRSAASLTTMDVATLVRHLGQRLAPATVNGTLTVLSGVLSYGVRQQVLPANVVRDLHRDDRPGTERTKQPRYLTQDDAEAILRRMSPAYKPVASLMYYLGLRVSEALGLTWADIDLAAGTVTVSQQRGPDGKLAPLKTKAGHRTLSMSTVVREQLLAAKARVDALQVARIDRAGLIFPAGNRHNARRAVARAAYLAGLNTPDVKPVGCHDLRHSFAYHGLTTMGLPVTKVSAMLGHANPQVTLTTYAGLADDGLADASDALAASFGS